MKRKLLHNLACQADGFSPMDLYVFVEKDEVVDGLLFCPKCSRWYPIRGKLPEILPDHVRAKNADLFFLQKWRKLSPKRVLVTGKPFNLEK
jgi:uncharacterized protein YbaR (Trm112 family)